MRPISFSTAILFLAISTGIVIAQHDTQVSNSPSKKLSAEQWQADIRFLGAELPNRHRNAFHHLKREDFESAVKTLYDKAPRISEDEIVVGMMKLVAMVKDGHTSLVPRPFFRSGLFPVQYYWFSDGLYVIKAAPEHADLVGARVLKIGDTGVDDALRVAGEVSATDNEMGRKGLTPLMIRVPEVLAGTRIHADKTRLTLLVEKDGKQSTVELRPTAAFETIGQAPPGWKDLGEKSAAALYRKGPNNFYWHEYLKDQKLLYVQHNAIANKPDEPVEEFYRRVLSFADTNPVDKFVLDLRFNGGGNNTLNRAVIVQLIKSKLDQRGKFFVIVGRETFSAAQNLVNLLEKYTQATFVGEPTAAHPNHYGDARNFVLPNSNLTVRASTLWWQDLDPRDQRYWTAPEIAAELSSDDYRNGRDPALQAVIDYKNGTSFQAMMDEAQRSGDIRTFIAKYREYKVNPQHRFVDTEGPVNRAGYWLLERKRTPEAIEIFKLNVEFYPRSANVYDSLGDGYRAIGNNDEAIKAYEKALSIDPNYPSSLEALRRLRGTTTQ